MFNPRTGRLENWEPDPETAPHIEELFGRKNAGVPLREVARDWARRGIGNGSGNPFTDKDLRSMLGRPCYAGLRAHVPGSRGRGSRVVAESQLFPATWDAIVAMDDLDASAEALMLDYLSDPDVVAEIRSRDGAEGEELKAARAALARLKRLNAELAEAVSAEQISVTLAGASERNNAKITELGVLIKSLTVASPLMELIEPGGDLRERWTLTPIGARREIMRDVFSPSRLGELRVQRVPASAPKGPRRYPVRERVALWQAEAG